MVLNRKDLLAGGFFIAVGAAFAAYAAITLDMGTSSRMGSGYFPVMLGLIMVGLGLAIVLTAERVEIETARPLPLRAIIALTLAPIVFGLTVRGLGLVAASMLCLATVTTASSRISPKMAAALIIGLTLFCVLVFSVGLRLPLALFPANFPG